MRTQNSSTRKSFQITKSLFAAAIISVLFCSPAAPSPSISPFEPAMELLVRDGFDKDEIQRIFTDQRAEPALESVSLFFVHSEARLDYDQFTTDDSVAKARAYIDAYREDLERAEKEYGVDKNVIAAILLVETRLGKYTGKSPILNTLATMVSLSDPIRRETLFEHISSNPRRLPRDKFEKKADRKSRWAYDQLKAFVKYTRRENIDPFTVQGSYAGAFGIAQFMPTSIMAYAVDGDGDGRINLFTHADSIASAANYLKQFGWTPGVSRKKAEKAVHAYNRSSYYVNAILTIRDKLGK